jgi:flap endonuclease-1
MFCKLKSNNCRILFVIDGKPSSLKDLTLDKRKQRLEQAIKIESYLKSVNSKDYELIKKMKQKTIKITKEMIQTLKKFLNLLGIPLIQAKGQGETQCVWCLKKGFADILISDDWDAILYDIPEFYRNISFKGAEFECQYVNLKQNLEILGINKNQLIDSVLLTGTDYNPGVYRIGPITSLKLISEFGSIQKLISEKSQKYKFLPIIKYQTIRDHLSDLQDYNLNVSDLEFRPIDLQGLKSFLIDFCNFSHQFILDNLKFLV